MSDRTPPPQPGATRVSDALVQLYHDANAEDMQAGQAHGPSAAASERILAHARTHAAKHATAADSTATLAHLPAAPNLQPTFSGEPANEHRWLRHALGSLAAIGLISWLTLRHLDEPGALQPESPASVSISNNAAQATDAVTRPQDEAASASMAAPAAKAPAVVVANAAPQTQLKEKTAPELTNRSSNAIKSEANLNAAAASTEKYVAPHHSEPSVTEALPEQLAITQPPAAIVAAETASAVVAEIAPSQEALAKPSPSSSANARAKAQTAKTAKPFPYCDEAMPIEAQTEQLRRIQARLDAQAAGTPLPQPAPVCRPLPKKLTSPDLPPIDSR